MKKEELLKCACQLTAAVVSNPQLPVFQAAEHRQKLLWNILNEVQDCAVRIGIKIEEE